MSSVLRVSDAASIGLHAMVLLAAKAPGTARGPLLSNHEIASTLNVSEAHLSKVLQRLAKAGLVTSTRGPKGGFGLPPGGEKVSLLDVYEVIEGPLKPSDCLLATRICGGGGNCIFGGLLKTLNRQVRQNLTKTRLAEAAKALGRRK